MISEKDTDILRAIAKAGNNYDLIQRLLSETEWEIQENEADIGHLRILIHDTSGECYPLIISRANPDGSPFSLLTFSVFPDSEADLAAFNMEFHFRAATLARYFGIPSASGSHQLPFRSWPYAYKRWTLPEGEFTLVQDEFDIQFGMDVSLWIQPVGTSIEQTLHHDTA
jgi:hypothetical protein